MEPLRGFPEFMRAAAVAQQHFPELQVVVFGNDRSAYSYESPHPSGSWKDYMLEELKDELDLNRLHFTGLLNLWGVGAIVSGAAIFIVTSRGPYVVSWGVFQGSSLWGKVVGE